MDKEKVILSFVAILVGLLFAAVGFYFYQGAKSIDFSKQKTVSIKSPTPTPSPSIFLQVDEPKDEQVFDKKIIKISGKTANDAIIVILLQNSEEVITPNTLGVFSTTVTINNGENFMEITAMGSNGESTSVNRTVTYSTESF